MQILIIICTLPVDFRLSLQNFTSLTCVKKVSKKKIEHTNCSPFHAFLPIPDFKAFLVQICRAFLSEIDQDLRLVLNLFLLIENLIFFWFKIGVKNLSYCKAFISSALLRLYKRMRVSTNITMCMNVKLLTKLNLQIPSFPPKKMISSWCLIFEINFKGNS